MKRLLPAFVLVALVSYGVVAFAGRPQAAKRTVAPDNDVTTAVTGTAPSVAVKPHVVRKTESVLEQVLGSTYYSYAWNSGGPRHTVWYKDATNASRTYMIYVTRAGDTWTGGRECTYVSYDGTTFSAPAPAISSSTQATYFSGIDVWMGGAADGLAGIGAGWAGSGTSYYCLEGSPGGGGFSTTAVTSGRDIQATNIDNAGSVIVNTSKGPQGDRTDYAFHLSTDFGTTWTPVDQSLVALATGGQSSGSLEPPIVAKNGNLYLFTDLAGTVAQVPPIGTATPDSASIFCVFKSTDKGTTWTMNKLFSDGVQYETKYYSLFSNFEQFDMLVDPSEKPHVVLNGYAEYQFAPSPDSLAETIDCVYWDETHGFKSLVNFDRTKTAEIATVIAKRDGNALGCSYPSIAATPDGQTIVCTWSQPSWSGSTVDTTAAGFVSSNVYYNWSNDGGGTWHTPVKLTNTTGMIEEFTDLADVLEDLGNGSAKARVTFIRGDKQNTGSSGTPGEAVYVEFNVTTSSVNDKAQKPFSFSLDQNYPNPFNPSTMISYTLPAASTVKLSVYNVLGQEVANLVNENQTAGSHNVTFNASNLSSGVYFYTIKAGNFTETKKMSLLK